MAFLKRHSLALVVALLVLFPLAWGYAAGRATPEPWDDLKAADALQQLLNGLSLGAVFALIAIGYTMVYGIIELINFAHGEIFMTGAYFAWLFAARAGLPAWLSVPAAILATGLLGLAVERLAYRPLRGAPRLNLLISAIGVSIILSYGAQIVFGPDPQPFPIRIENATWTGFGVTVAFVPTLIIAVACAAMLALHLFIRHTRTGLAMRASALDRTCAGLMGIDVDAVVSATFVVGSMLAAVAGILVGIRYDEIQPTMGYLAGIKAFSAAVLGGIGSIPGAMLGGVLIGVIENLWSAFVSSGYKDAFAFMVLIVVLLVKPSGLLNREGRVKI